jgi:DNA polymerase I-like protein with 3'-5' exonuclease and polymerase domains
VKEERKKICSDLKKRRTVIRNLADKCEGEALINYASNTQLLNILTGMKGLSKLEDLEDETLEKFERYPVMAAIRKYHGLAKEIGTYGTQWATEWMTHPCKEEGWLHPGDGRLHCIFNQYDAETGRSTSEKPNGQNLPQDKEVRSCFIADPPDESIRISICCDADTEHSICVACRQFCETKPEEYVIITADMSGAELRIIAELANDPIWIEAFGRGEDVHSVGTEILYPEKWPLLALPDCRYFALQTEETVAANTKRVLGELQRQKCKCPEHSALRDDNKATNFLLAYGGGPTTLAARIKKTLEAAREIMSLHAARFPKIWAYLELSGKTAQMQKKAFDMFGRRRLFPEPTWDRAKLKAAEDREEKLRLDKDEAAANKATFTTLHGRKPTKDELWLLTHRQPTNKEVANAFKAMAGSIERQGKNHCIQGTNATIAKKAMGCGYSPDGKPYLWHTFPQYKARLIKFVHDELVVHSPKRFAKQVAALIGDAFKRAAAEKMNKVIMEFDYNIAGCWQK